MDISYFKFYEVKLDKLVMNELNGRCITFTFDKESYIKDTL